MCGSGWNARKLIAVATDIVGATPDDSELEYPQISCPLSQHPADDGVWIGGVRALRSLPDDVGAVVSLCRVGDFDVLTTAEHLDVRLIDRIGDNANLDFVLYDTVRAIEQFRAEGKTVLFHCVQAVSQSYPDHRRTLRCAPQGHLYRPSAQRDHRGASGSLAEQRVPASSATAAPGPQHDVVRVGSYSWRSS
jgi:hypothetical protein